MEQMIFQVIVVLHSVFALALASQSGFGSINELKDHEFKKIVGSENAEEGEFPYQVSLQLHGLGPSGHYCGGSIISPYVVLTAGHCITAIKHFPRRNRNGIFVHAGLVSLKNDGVYEQVVKVRRTIVHPDFDGMAGPNDIALLILETPLIFEKHVQAIALPPEGYEPTGNTILSGWGITSKTNILGFPDRLHKATLPIVDIPACAAKLGVSPLDAESNICTGPINGTLSACSGDGGGPLMQDINGERTLVGIVSWGRMPCGNGYPTVYTKVSYFIDFINQEVKRYY